MAPVLTRRKAPNLRESLLKRLRRGEITPEMAVQDYSVSPEGRRQEYLTNMKIRQSAPLLRQRGEPAVPTFAGQEYARQGFAPYLGKNPQGVAEVVEDELARRKAEEQIPYAGSMAEHDEQMRQLKRQKEQQEMDLAQREMQIKQTETEGIKSLNDARAKRELAEAEGIISENETKAAKIKENNIQKFLEAELDAALNKGDFNLAERFHNARLEEETAHERIVSPGPTGTIYDKTGKPRITQEAAPDLSTPTQTGRVGGGWEETGPHIPSGEAPVLTTPDVMAPDLTGQRFYPGGGGFNSAQIEKTMKDVDTLINYSGIRPYIGNYQEGMNPVDITQGFLTSTVSRNELQPILAALENVLRLGANDSDILNAIMTQFKTSPVYTAIEKSAIQGMRFGEPGKAVKLAQRILEIVNKQY